MVQTALGAATVNAKRLGLSLQEYLTKNFTQKWCTFHKYWHDRSVFNKDKSRGDGLESKCREAKAEIHKHDYVSTPRTHYGPLPGPPRPGDKLQARARINQQVQKNIRPNPTSLPCFDCGDTRKRHEYDHYLGYAPEHHDDVQPVCSRCHAKRSRDREELKQVRNKEGRFMSGR